MSELKSTLLNRSEEILEVNLKEAIQSNLSKIVESTTINVELNTALKQRGLISKSEMEKMNKYQRDENNSEGAVYLYTNIAQRFRKAEGQQFMQILQETNNSNVVDILRNSTSGDTNEPDGRCSKLNRQKEIEFLRGFHKGQLTPNGKFEGLNLRDEEAANELLKGRATGGSPMWRLLQKELVGDSLEVRESIQRVSSVVKCLREGTVWWNPRADILPPNFIPRRVRRLTTSGEPEPKVLSELTKGDELLLWLVDAPGSGKSTVTTNLEEEWRKSTPSPRVIVRINLNLTLDPFQQQPTDDAIGLKSFLRKFVPYVPVDSLCRLPAASVKVIVLLDALDEVLPQHKGTMLRLLRSLLLSAEEAKQTELTSLVLRRPELKESLHLEKLFLTTRPHLRSLVEEEFKLDGHSLLPLDFSEQVEFLSKELSDEFKLTKDQVEDTFNSLSSSARLLMENPLMLFLFAQVVKYTKNYREFDIFDLYEKFMETKHTIHVVEKEAGDPTHPETRRRTKKLFKENLPFYSATALAQLRPEKTKIWSKFVTLPGGNEREELLSFGLLTANYSQQLRFSHRSFAEFFYARLLTTPSTPNLLRDTLFREIYSHHSLLGNVQEFVLCTLKSKDAERLLPLSHKWLYGSTWWKWGKGKKMGVTLERFLRSRLFPLLGEELLSSSVNLKHTKVIKTLTYVASEEANVEVRAWLAGRELEWVRRCLLNLPSASTPTHNWKHHQSELVTLLLCEHPDFLAQCLTHERIQSALSSCEGFLQIMCDQLKGRQRREIVERQIGRDALRKILMTWESLTLTLSSNTAAWWLAELFTGDDFVSFISTFISLVFGNAAVEFEPTWGAVIVCSLIANDLEVELLGHTRGDLSEISVQDFLGLFGGWEKGVAAMSYLIPTSHGTRFLEEVEETMMSCDSMDVVGGTDGATLLAKVFGDEGFSVWEKLEYIPFKFLPFVIRYGKIRNVKRIISSDLFAHHLSLNSASVVALAFVLSVLVDETDDTLNQLKSTKITESKYYKQSSATDLWGFLCRLTFDDLRQASLSTGLSNLKGQWPLVQKVNWGQIVLRLRILQNVPFTLNDNSLESTLEDLIRRLPCCEVPDYLQRFYTRTPSLQKLLLHQVEVEVSRERTPGHFGSPVSRCRMRGFIHFTVKFLKVFFNEMSTKWTQLFVMSVIVESRLPCPQGHYPWGWIQVSALIPSLVQKLLNVFEDENKSPHNLSRIFFSFLTEWEWTGVLHALEVIPTDNSFNKVSQSQFRSYGRPETPLLRVWLRHFGVDDTRKVAEDFYWWGYPRHPGEAVLLAVELGSLPMLQQVAWPSLLWWRDAEGSTLLNVAVAIWGESHEVLTFLRNKFSFPFNSKNKQNNVNLYLSKREAPEVKYRDDSPEATDPFDVDISANVNLEFESYSNPHPQLSFLDVDTKTSTEDNGNLTVTKTFDRLTEFGTYVVSEATFNSKSGRTVFSNSPVLKIHPPPVTLSLSVDPSVQLGETVEVFGYVRNNQATPFEGHVTLHSREGGSTDVTQKFAKVKPNAFKILKMNVTPQNIGDLLVSLSSNISSRLTATKRVSVIPIN